VSLKRTPCLFLGKLRITLIDGCSFLQYNFIVVEKRVHPRVEATLKVNVALPTKTITAFTKNISEEGLFISTEEAPEMDTDFSIIMEIPGVKKGIDALCKVVWVNHEAEKGIGVKIIKMEEFYKRAFRIFVNRRLMSLSKS